MKALFVFASVVATVFSQIVAAVPVFAADGDTNSVAPVQNENQIFPTPDYTGNFTERTTLTGDWDGTRQTWANNGVTFDGNVTQVTQGVVSGGRKTGWGYSGRGEATLNLDTAKMGLWPGGLITVMGEGNFGSSLSSKTGSLIGTNANNLFPEPDSDFVVPNVTFTQFLSPTFGIALGKFATISDTAGDMNEFAHGKGGRQFLNPSFNFNPITALTVPYSTLGATAIIAPSKELVITAGVLDPHGKPGNSGVDTLFENGATLLAEGRYTTNFFSKTGHQLLAATYSTSSYADLDQRAANFILPGLPVKEADGSWSAYWNADQYFYQPDPKVAQGVGLFTRFGISDGQANPIKSFASIGIGGKGGFFCRENDAFGLGYSYTWAADNRITSAAGFGDAQGIEAYYSIAITRAIFLSPDIQWIQPSQERIDSSWVTGVRLFTQL
jgi:porin